jgi:hypothetical protein
LQKMGHFTVILEIEVLMHVNGQILSRIIHNESRPESVRILCHV